MSTEMTTAQERYAARLSMRERNEEMKAQMEEERELAEGGTRASRDFSNVFKLLKDNENNFEAVATGKEMASDASVVLSAARCLAAVLRCSQQANVDQQLVITEYADQVRDFARMCLLEAPRKVLDNGVVNPLLVLDDDEVEDRYRTQRPRNGSEITLEQWSSLGNELALVNEVYPLTYMRPLLSSKDIQPSQMRAKRERRTRDPMAGDKNAEKQVLKEKIKTEEDGEDQSVMKELDFLRKTMKRVLKKRKVMKIGFYEFVLDPDDYGRTIENMFHTSILLRDGQFRMDKDARGLPVIYPTSDNDLKQMTDSRANMKTTQAIMAFSYDFWKNFCDKLQLERAIIKPLEHRKEGRTAQGAAEDA